MRGLVGGGKATANTLLLTHAAPSPTHTHVQPWANRNVVSVGGIFAAAYYTLCVNVTSVKYHRASAGTVTAAVTVDMVGAGAQITGYFVGTGPMAGPAGAMLDTVATTTISFVGLEMGTATGNATGLVTANYTNGVQTYAAKGCAVINATLMTCTTVPGVGANLLWTVKLRGVTVPALVPLLTSYYAPTVTSLANTTGLPSGGGTEIVVRGRYLGVNGRGVLAYGPSAANLMYSCVLQKPSWVAAGAATDASTDAVSSCPAAKGAGANLVWSLTVGGQTVIGGVGGAASATQLLSYSPPNITGVSVATNGTNPSSLSKLDTRGCVPPAPCTTVLLSGTGFGGDSRNVRTVTYGLRTSGAPQYAMSCVPSPAGSTTQASAAADTAAMRARGALGGLSHRGRCSHCRAPLPPLCS